MGSKIHSMLSAQTNRPSKEARSLWPPWLTISPDHPYTADNLYIDVLDQPPQSSFVVDVIKMKATMGTSQLPLKSRSRSF